MTGIGRWPLWRRLGLAAGAGALGALGLAPFGLWPLALLALAALPALYLSAGRGRDAALIGWAFATGWFANGLSWIVEPFLVEPEVYGWMAPFALVLMAGGLALFWGAAFWGGFRAASRPGARIAALIVVLSLAEFGRAYLLTGFPWAALAQVWTATPLLQLLAWIGPQGLALTTLLAALLPGAALVTRRHRLLSLLPLALLGLAALACARLPEPALTGHTVRVVQPNARQDQKWDPQWMPVFFRRQIEYTAADPRPDLVVWPESSVPVWLEEAGPTFARIAEAARGADVVLGIQRYEDLRIYNSLAHLDGNGRLAGVYDKHHLVPFGEYMPLGDIADRFGLHGFAAQAGQGYSPGPGAELMGLGDFGPALPLICYEAVFPQDVNAAPGRPRLLLQITNDAWFGTRSGPYQHLAQARMRAVEQGVPMVRAANTGISAVISPRGRILTELPLGEAGYADALLPQPLAPTLYARTGDWPVFGLLVLAALALWALRRRGLSRK
ncbi:apolipoprotein N-acyltransferase [Pseudodonghicola flavimaris]|uniref:Apolipoprotein N-acyltransferase n=1 Tax=Pseudodonghicola flavimaris TaxID=3050036 RepID=A0ABT7F3M5_9RHOB|nr:apolipoprotein N-acyltransferase [Pseudodonghicola flavimaris]MDK3019034.1 apolipoprotein N-acyltransferase [Pseudodonghicola flavimaris]